MTDEATSMPTSHRCLHLRQTSLSTNLEQDVVRGQNEEADEVEGRLREISASIVLPPAITMGPLARAMTTRTTDVRKGGDGLRDQGEWHMHQISASSRQPRRSSLLQGVKNVSKGLLRYLKTPVGIIAGIYGLLVVLWGAALVIILAGWTPMTQETKDNWVEICSQVLNGLFTITGVGFVPWRVRDAWHMSVITRYRRKIAKLHRRSAKESRSQHGVTDLPGVTHSADRAGPSKVEGSVDEERGCPNDHLHAAEIRRLSHSEDRFMASQPWYRREETKSHKIFPAGLALTITCLVVSNSIFQCCLCGVMWGLNRHDRPAWTTGLFIGLSFGSGIVAAGLIWWGGKMTRKDENEFPSSAPATQV